MLVLGYGRVGSTIVDDLISSNIVSFIGVCDKNWENIKNLSFEKIQVYNFDLNDEITLVNLMKEYDVVICALPSYLGFKVEEAAIKAGVDLVDVSYTLEDPFILDSRARDANVTIVPDCGVAPGLSNMLVGYGYSEFDEVKSVKILVGGLPQNPIPPLDYIMTWSSEDLIEEYSRPVRIIEEGVLKYVEPLTGIELVNFEGLGIFEAFYTDGLRTLLTTLSSKILEMCEKTLRYPGHAEKIMFLKKLGMFDDEPLIIDDLKIEPRKFLAKLLDKKFRINLPDMLLLRIVLKGVKGGLEFSKIFQVIDLYDEEKNITALSRTTGYTAAGVALLLAKKIIREKGVLPPEMIGFNKMYMNHLLKYLAERGVTVLEI
ncbi:MAG: saccharopine dehydrogenase C-terminal domain-containing protein [Nitrososphaerota archaeon]|nr:saccharopine dehydrogenase C-terminal domain-containing protein [Nitrososphaerota archaeon]